MIFFLAVIATAVRGAETPRRILVLGDSIAAGYGLAPDQSFPARLETLLSQAGHTVQIINAGVSGDTSAGGLARLDDALAAKPQDALVELGANDALRGIDPKITYANLDRIVSRFASAHVNILLLGMRAPANWGRDYQQQFDAIYPRLAAAHHVALYPFLLEGIAFDPALNQPDLLHPNARGAEIIAQRLAPHVIALLDGKAER